MEQDDGANEVRTDSGSAPLWNHGDVGDPLALITLGHRLVKDHNLEMAEYYFRTALSLNPQLPMGHNNLGWVRQALGDMEGAIASYRQALDLNGSLDLARRNLAALLSDLGRFAEAIPLWDALAAARPNDIDLLREMIGIALRAGKVERAAKHADRYAVISRGSKWYPHRDPSAIPPEGPTPKPFVTIPKLQHDIEQLRYLQAQGILGDEFTSVIRNHELVLANAISRRVAIWQPLEGKELELLGDVYGRIVHLRTTPFMQENALSHEWPNASVEEEYLRHHLGVVVVDNFLSEKALEEVRHFCLQSTVWFANRYAHGRLGAFFRDGFNCPLLVQIAEELRLALPRLIGDRHRLLQLWAFKYNYRQPVTSAHADFASVNVNFWITPDDANLDKDSGGLVIYDVEAPQDWNFVNYNKEGTKISALLAAHNSNCIIIPYRANRAVIFNSDLFHTTAPITFREGYENRRINITMLYGRREDSFQKRS